MNKAGTGMPIHLARSGGFAKLLIYSLRILKKGDATISDKKKDEKK
jgi:hypothetical protein